MEFWYFSIWNNANWQKLGIFLLCKHFHELLTCLICTLIFLGCHRALIFLGCCLKLFKGSFCLVLLRVAASKKLSFILVKPWRGSTLSKASRPAQWVKYFYYSRIYQISSFRTNLFNIFLVLYKWPKVRLLHTNLVKIYLVPKEWRKVGLFCWIIGKILLVL